MKKHLQEILDRRIQIYLDKGKGFSEQESYYLPDVYTDEYQVEAEIPFDGNVTALRIDPADRYYVVKGGKPVQVSRMKDFARVYKEEKKAIKGFIRKNKMRFLDMDDKDRTFMEIMNFADNN